MKLVVRHREGTSVDDRLLSLSVTPHSAAAPSPRANQSTVPAKVDASGYATRYILGSTISSPVTWAVVGGNDVVVSAVVSNMTAGGASPTMDTQGRLTWTPVAIDRATSNLVAEVTLRSGARVSAQLPVVVLEPRTLDSVTLSADQDTYDAVNGGLTFKVTPAVAGATVTWRQLVDAQGRVEWQAQVRGADGLRIEMINAADSASTGPTTAEVDKPKRVRALGRTLQGLLPHVSFYSRNDTRGRYYETSLPDGSWVGVSTSRAAADVMVRNPLATEGYFYSSGYESPIFQLDGSCSKQVPCQRAGAPVILVTGLTRGVFGSAGAEQTWGTLVGALMGATLDPADTKQHDVFEFKWAPEMRLEDAAGRLELALLDVVGFTGKKPLIVAHGAGGVVAELALTDGAVHWNAGSVFSTTATGWQRGGWGNRWRARDAVRRLIVLGAPGRGLAAEATTLQPSDGSGTIDLVRGLAPVANRLTACNVAACAQLGMAVDPPVQAALRSMLADVGALPQYPSALDRGETLMAWASLGDHAVPRDIVVGVGSASDPVFASPNLTTFHDGVVTSDSQRYWVLQPPDPVDLRRLSSAAVVTQVASLTTRYHFVSGGSEGLSNGPFGYFGMPLAFFDDYLRACRVATEGQYSECPLFSRNVYGRPSYLRRAIDFPYSPSSLDGAFNEPPVPYSFFDDASVGQYSIGADTIVAGVRGKQKAVGPSQKTVAPFAPIRVELREKVTNNRLYAGTFYTDAGGLAEITVPMLAVLSSALPDRASVYARLEAGDGVAFYRTTQNINDMTPSRVNVTLTLTPVSGIATGELRGRLVDRGGRGIANGTVTLRAGASLGEGDFTQLGNSATSRTLTTDADGFFYASGLAEGRYGLQARGSTFLQVIVNDVAVSAAGVSTNVTSVSVDARTCGSGLTLQAGACIGPTLLTFPSIDRMFVYAMEADMDPLATASHVVTVLPGGQAQVSQGKPNLGERQGAARWARSTDGTELRVTFDPPRFENSFSSDSVNGQQVEIQTRVPDFTVRLAGGDSFSNARAMIATDTSTATYVSGPLQGTIYATYPASSTDVLIRRADVRQPVQTLVTRALAGVEGCLPSRAPDLVRATAQSTSDGLVLLSMDASLTYYGAEVGDQIRMRCVRDGNVTERYYTRLSAEGAIAMKSELWLISPTASGQGGFVERIMPFDANESVGWGASHWVGQWLSEWESFTGELNLSQQQTFNLFPDGRVAGSSVPVQHGATWSNISTPYELQILNPIGLVNLRDWYPIRRAGSRSIVFERIQTQVGFNGEPSTVDTRLRSYRRLGEPMQ